MNPQEKENKIKKERGNDVPTPEEQNQSQIMYHTVFKVNQDAI